MPEIDSPAPSAGYRIDGVYVAEQHYEPVPKDALRLGEAEDDRKVRVAWDWRPLGPRRFEVMLELRLEAVVQAPEAARARVIGIFEAVGDMASVPLRDFVRFNAPAILFPFGREVISAMTGRGPSGAFHLHPVNIRSIFEQVDMAATSGAQFLDQHPDVAKSFGLDYKTTALIKATVDTSMVALGSAASGTSAASPAKRLRRSKASAKRGKR